MPTEIESLELKIVSDSKGATSGIDGLARSLKKLKQATNGGLGLPSVSKGLNDVTANSKKSASSFTDLYNKLKVIGTGFKKIGGMLGSAIQKSSDYVETMNLFKVSMGQYAGEAQKYAETVGEVMGIDPGEWMRNQGVFMTLATGFGVASDRAAVMSKNLTQLGYDLSSFFNISTEDAMQKLQSGLAGELEPLRRIGYDLSQAKLEVTALELGIDKSVSSMTQAEKAQLRYYAIMTQVTKSHGDMARTLDEPANQLRVLKAQFEMVGREIGNVFIPLLNKILPVAIAATKVIRNLASSLANMVGFELPEVDYSGVENMSGAAETTSSSMEDATDAAKKLKSYMLGFDELNVINPDDGSSGSIGSADTLGGLDFELPEYDFLGEAVDNNVNKIVATIEEALGKIAPIIAGATLVIGALLTFSGANIPLGIALMLAGAAGLATALALNWDSISETLSGPIGTATGIISSAAFVIGAILAFSGTNIPLGIALMMGGAAGLATIVAVNWDSISEALQGPIGAITAIISGALIALGAVLAFSGMNIALGIALMVAGAAGLTTVLALNWDSISEALQGPIGAVTAAISGALLALGAILAFSGANIPLGIALMLVGAGGLATVIVANWDSIKEVLEGPIGVVAGIVSGALLVLGALLAFSGASIPLGIALLLLGAAGMATVITANWDSMTEALGGPVGAIAAIISGALLVLGAVLAFSGIGIPIGLALMVAGAAGLATVVALNWNGIKDAMEGPIGAITAIVSGALLALGAILCFTGVGIPLGIALMLAGAAGLATVVALNWDSMTEALGGPVGAITAIISGALLVLGAVLAFSGVGTPIGLALMVAGAAGLATVVALNWDSMTEALQGPVGKIAAILGGALLVLGAILLFTGVGIPLGLGLMLAGAASLGTVVAVNWDFLVDKVREIWDSIKKFWNTYIAPIFTAEWWINLGKKCINGLITGFEGGVNGIIGMFENMINWIVDGLNDISFDVPDWVPLIGGKTFGFNIPNVSFGRVSIPRLAEGGLPETGQMFIAREAGAEMVGNIGRRTAVVNNDQIVASISGGVAEANEEQNALLREQNALLQALLEKESGVYLDGKNLTNSVEKYQRERGRVLITGGVV